MLKKSNHKSRLITATLAGGATALLVLASCSSPEPTDAAADEQTNSIPSDSAIETATSSIQPIIDAPTDFTVTEPMGSLPTGARIAIVDCGTPICALMADAAQEPAELLGMSTTVIQAGMTPDSIAATFDSIILDGYDGVMVAALPFQMWEREFEKLREADVAIATTGVTGLPDDFHADLSSEEWNTQAGSWLADWVISQGNVAANSVIYRTPELGFTNDIVAAYEGRTAELCVDCNVRVIDIPVETLATTGAQTIVDDLTANPDTSIAVLSIGEQSTGLVQGMSVAGIDIPVTMFGAEPAQLNDIRQGDLHSGLVLDSQALVWTIMDSLARQIVGEEVSVGAKEDKLITQIVTTDNLEGDTTNGWRGYPDMRERFQELWQVD